MSDPSATDAALAGAEVEFHADTPIEPVDDVSLDETALAAVLSHCRAGMSSRSS